MDIAVQIMGSDARLVATCEVVLAGGKRIELPLELVYTEPSHEPMLKFDPLPLLRELYEVSYDAEREVLPPP